MVDFIGFFELTTSCQLTTEVVSFWLAAATTAE